MEKKCDFGSTSTNRKCFDNPQEMAIEEDIITKHTTLPCRAPEVWDLYRREVICDKVDVWVLDWLWRFRGEYRVHLSMNFIQEKYKTPFISLLILGSLRGRLPSKPISHPTCLLEIGTLLHNFRKFRWI